METLTIIVKKFERDGAILWKASTTIFHEDRTFTTVEFEDIDEELVKSKMRQGLMMQKINREIKFI